jgi:acetyl coenzyme A synthetase (ADP forming)-like protein
VGKNLKNLLLPKSIAIVGASSSPEKVGAIILKNILASKFQGPVYPVNPGSDSICDLKCYPNIASLPEIVDLVLIAIPSAGVNQVLTEIGEKGIKNVVVFSAGFKEIGLEGKVLEDALIQTCQKYGINLLGPNCLGFVSKICPVNATFGQAVSQDGNLRFISQSGALAASLFDYFNSTGLGFSEFITVGNKSVINENDILNYFLEKDAENGNADQTHPIGLYLESISDGKGFLDVASKLSQKNPLFILKPGKTTAAAKAMQSHTGSIAGENNVLDAALTQAGVIRCNTLEDYFDLSKALAWEKTPEGPKVAVVSNAGGPAVISADAVLTEGLELVEFDAQTQEKLHQILPRYASVLDPVDVLGDALADRIYQACEVVLQTNLAQSLVVILTPQVMTQIVRTADLIGNLAKKYNTPIFCSFIGGDLVAEGKKKLNEYKIPSFRFPERAISTIGLMWKWRKWQQQLSDMHICQNTDGLIAPENNQNIKKVAEKAESSCQGSLDNLDANEILRLAGIPTPPTQTVVSLEDAKKFVEENHWPVALKLSSPGLLHKSDLGAVIKDISSEGELEAAMINLDHKITQLSGNTAGTIIKQIQKYIMSGTEVIVGVKKDPTFGPVLLFGAGGSLAELIVDRNLRLLPIDSELAKQLVERSKIYKILKGYRGEAPLALDKLYDVIVRLGKVIEFLPDVSEIEINPLIITQNDVWAVDCKVVFDQEQKHTVAMPRFHVAKALECKTLAGKFHNFIFETETPIAYKPGQYISVKVAEARINSYSIASNEGENKFSLLIDTSPGGPGSKYFDNLNEGDKISFLGPFGTFTYKPDDSIKHLLFLGTGSGCAPLRCMIDDLLKVKHVQIPITLYLGLRYQTDIFWQEYFKKLSEEFPNFHFVLVISKPDANCQEKTGHITDLIGQDFPDTSGFAAYLCGNKLMIEETTGILVSRGMAKEKVYTEKF